MTSELKNALSRLPDSVLKRFPAFVAAQVLEKVFDLAFFFIGMTTSSVRRDETVRRGP
jgi:hypothetical protein